MPRNPELLIFATIQPVMFVLLFNYVFGGAIGAIPGYDDYTQYLLPGVFAQTVLFGSAFTGVGVAEDLQRGIIDRLRSLPMFHPAVLIGRTISDLIRNILTFVVMLVVGFLIGFRFGGTLAAAMGATLLLLGFSYAFSWIQAYIGLSVKSVEAANSAGFIWMFPLTFVSSAFVSTETMPVVVADHRRRQPLHPAGQRLPRPLQRQRPRLGAVDLHRLGDRHHGGLRHPGISEVQPVHRGLTGCRPPGNAADQREQPAGAAMRCVRPMSGSTHRYRYTDQRRAGSSGFRSTCAWCRSARVTQ